MPQVHDAPKNTAEEVPLMRKFLCIVLALILTLSIPFCAPAARAAASDEIDSADLLSVTAIEIAMNDEAPEISDTSIWAALDCDIDELNSDALTFFVVEDSCALELYSYTSKKSYTWYFPVEEEKILDVCAIFLVEESENFGIFDIAIYMNLSNETYLAYSELMNDSSDPSLYGDATEFSMALLFDALNIPTDNGSAYSSPSSSAEPFDKLTFSGFLYEKSKYYDNATISGTVRNNNSFPVTGYFYVIFYKNGSVVHRELVSLGTIAAHSTGTWSDIIYHLDYDRIEYADSTVVRK
jgi:hypothetical protein